MKKEISIGIILIGLFFISGCTADFMKQITGKDIEVNESGDCFKMCSNGKSVTCNEKCVEEKLTEEQKQVCKDTNGKVQIVNNNERCICPTSEVDNARFTFSPIQGCKIVCESGYKLEEEPLVCCKVYGFGSLMKEVNVHYEWRIESECSSEGIVGGGRDIVSDILCGGTKKKCIKIPDQELCENSGGEWVEQVCGIEDGIKICTLTRPYCKCPENSLGFKEGFGCNYLVKPDYIFSILTID